MDDIPALQNIPTRFPPCRHCRVHGHLLSSRPLLLSMWVVATCLLCVENFSRSPSGTALGTVLIPTFNLDDLFLTLAPSPSVILTFLETLESFADLLYSWINTPTARLLLMSMPAVDRLPGPCRPKSPFVPSSYLLPCCSFSFACTFPHHRHL